ncbi:MAG TPA: DUF6600 domain-containing protein [Candidatus Angelobacter sp.]|nr:DUF6600 domain-containing protein [Candidatus Angelobacter sp.]
MSGKFLAALMFAVTMMVGAWAQTDDYSQGPPDQGYPPAAQGPESQGPGSQESGPQESGPSAPGPDDGAPRSEGPAPAVAHISLIKGDVSAQRGDTGDWAATTVNAPVMRGDQIATGDKARAEIQLDSANVVRLAAHSQMKLADLTRQRIQIQVAQGYADYTVFKGNESDVEIDTPNVSVHPTKPGRYRVQVNSDAETDVIVRDGEAEITTPQGSTRVRQGELITIRGTDNPEYKISEAPEKDDWDQWNRDRDKVMSDSQSWGRTNHNYTGVNDLDGYGRWVYVPGYGNVWQPYQQATWAPYQAGRWVWEPYYGWTWVSYEPWGWAPYHYGRWFLYSGSWCWWPGPVYVSYRPVWSPAFVFFVGFGHRAGFGFGSIGWFPVGPFDPFFPWYGRGFNRVNVINVTNINIINRGRGFAPLGVRGRQPFFSNARLVETNARVRGSITTVSSADFGRGDFHNRHFGVDENQWREGRVMTANLPVVPSRESLRATPHGVGPSSSVQPRSNERFFTQHRPPAGPESFHNQVEHVQRVVGPQGINARTGIAEVPRNDHPSGAGVESRGSENNGRFGRSESNNSESNGRFGRSEGNNAATSNEAPRSGWSKFGSPSGRSGGEPGSNGPRSEQSPVMRSNDQGRVSRTDNSTQSPVMRSNDQGRVSRTDSGAGPQNAGPQNERGGWQRFPSNNDRGTRSNDAPMTRNNRVDSSGSGKPPLELHRPIVTPRQDSRPDMRNDQGYRPPPESRGNDRYSPPSRGNDRYSPPSRGESPRYSPPSRSEPRYSPPSRSERGGSSSSHGGGERSGGHESRSSGPKQR